MTLATKPTRAPLFASIVVILILLGALGYVYVTSNAALAAQGNSISSLNVEVANEAGSIGSLNGQVSSQAGQIGSLGGRVSSFQTQVWNLTANLDQQISARKTLEAKLTSANASIAQLSNEVSTWSEQVVSQNSEIAAQQEILNLEVQSTLVNGATLTIPANTTTDIVHFQASQGGYFQISGSSDTELVIVTCYGVTTQAACLTSTNFYLVAFGTGGTFNVPLMPGDIWVDCFSLQSGTATLTVVEYT